MCIYHNPKIQFICTVRRLRALISKQTLHLRCNFVAYHQILVFKNFFFKQPILRAGLYIHLVTCIIPGKILMTPLKKVLTTRGSDHPWLYL